MATTLKTVVRKQRRDGFYPVYVRVSHNRQTGYIKTDKILAPSKIGSNGEMNDPVVNEYCSDLILKYSDRLNRTDVTSWTLNEVIEYLTAANEEISFTDYAVKHINKMINDGHDRNARNYKLAVEHLKRYLGTENILFSQMTSTTINLWIESMRKLNRAKEMYPICLRQIFKAALVELNDEEKGLIRIKFNPWMKVQIPKADKAEQKAISAEECREFFNRPLPKTKMLSSLPELGRDVALLVLCLGGINTVDLFEMKKSNYRKGIISYKRAKTRHARADEAYIEMRVEPFIKPTIDKYLSDKEDEYLFNFHKRYCDSDSFNANVNSGIKKICDDMGVARADSYSVYTFRHSWGTFAQNDCGANLYEVAFGMNHSHGLKVTRGYVKMDFSPAWELNKKIIEFVFFSNTPSKQGMAKDIETSEDKLFRISKKMMIYARAYFKGEVIGELTDMGFKTVDDVIKAVAHQIPSGLSEGCCVQFRITNCDTQREVVYERTKGKGF
jgi:integrase